ncbi:hypothetical protein [Amycolatopsis rubida]|uniref:Uncharacterized protein n=1 Tax=Amycolatopsis rubida TaxID=112413 RepID=A0A1I5GNP5_9PSEU|nr:hypothetical protein [Amycolatopsis rubida]SFO37466.1 hypothetical protein SAMN05421854_1011710 [Amycolatopsis rubida]
MSEEQKETAEDKKRLRMSSVLAAALAAVTAALLGSTLGVAGTVIGAGVASVVSTVGGELYLRSLQRTRDAARKAMETAARRSRGGMVPVEAVRESASGDAATMQVAAADLANMPTVRLRPTEPEKAEGLGEKLRKMRWPLIIASSAVAFVVALVVLLGLDWTTKGNVSTGLIPRQPDTSQHQDDHPDNTPSSQPQVPPTGESRSNDPTSSPTTEPSAPPSSQATQQTQPPSSSSKPSTGSREPSASQTPTAPAVPSNANE